jgi:ubiquinone/menaquinone biosynthesis C-methylase UbiE
MTRELEIQRIQSTYSKRLSGLRYTYFEPATLFACQERERKTLAVLSRVGITSLQDTRILEVGCGTGFWLREFVKWGARPENIHGIDTLPERITAARRLCPAGITLDCASADRLRIPDGDYDLVVQSTMFTSILDRHMRIQVAREMLRVLRPKGYILWYDFTVDNPSNPDVRGIKAKEIRELFPTCRMEFHKLTLAPPVARPIARISSALHNALACIVPLRTHLLALITPT